MRIYAELRGAFGYRGLRILGAKSSCGGGGGRGTGFLVRGFYLSCHNKETRLFTMDPHYGNLSKTPEQEPSSP